MNKDSLREAMKSKRRSLSPEFIKDASKKITDSVLVLDCLEEADCIMVYLSAFREPDTKPLIQSLLNEGKRICVPTSDTSTFTIKPALISAPDDLIKGAYGIYEPKTVISVPLSEIDVILIPGIAFSASGDRLGFGKGYYDRLLNNFNGQKIGICYDFQICTDIPVSGHDVKMDMIITEKRIYNDF